MDHGGLQYLMRARPASSDQLSLLTTDPVVLIFPFHLRSYLLPPHTAPFKKQSSSAPFWIMKVLSRNDIARECEKLLSAIDPSIVDQEDSISGTVKDQVPSKESILVPFNDCSINFHWWDERFDVLKHFRGILPRLESVHDVSCIEKLPQDRLQPKVPILSPPPSDRQESCPDLKRRRTDSVDPLGASSEDSSQGLLPKFYYKPWPKQTHKLSFPGEIYRKFPEGTAATLTDFTGRMQSDDSIELGLRITAHIHRDRTPLTIIPSTALWHILDKPHILEVTEENVSCQVVVNNIRRAICPYINFNVGLSEGFSTMMLHGRHWYVILLKDAKNLLSGLVTCLESVSQEHGIDNAPSLMTAYGKRVEDINFESVRLVVMDSLGCALDNRGWESVKKFMFISLVQALSTAVCTAPVQRGIGRISTMHVEQQQAHFASLSYQAVKKVLWSSRVFVKGPEQCNGRSCGAYGLASVWKMSSHPGLDELSRLIEEELGKKGTPIAQKRRRLRRKRNRKNPATADSSCGFF